MSYKPSNTPNVGNNDFSNNSMLSTEPLYIPRKEEEISEQYNKNIKLNVLDVNRNKYNQHDYENNFNKNFNKQLSLEHEPDISYKKKNNYLVISSVDRDISSYPSSSNFIIDLDKEYRNIIEIELITAIIPDKNDVKLEPYLLFNVKELDNVTHSNNKYIDESFAMLQIASPIVSDSFINIDKRTFENTILYYQTPKARLSRMTISITNSTGDIFEFSSTPGGDGTTTKAYQCQFVFKVVTLDTDRTGLNHRNVF